MSVITRPMRVCMEARECTECGAGRGAWCLLDDGTIGVHPARVRAWQSQYSHSQHERAVEARERLEDVHRDIVTAAACACPDCPSNVELADWLNRLGLLAGEQ